jgi:arsenate reductase
MKIQFYHNPSCGTSRNALALLIEKCVEPAVRNLIDEPLTLEELENLLNLLDLNARDLVRTNHPIWLEQFAELELNDEEEIMLALLEHPAMMQRPIGVSDSGKAVLARPAERILELLAI